MKELLFVGGIIALVGSALLIILSFIWYIVHEENDCFSYHLGDIRGHFINVSYIFFAILLLGIVLIITSGIVYCINCLLG